MRVTATFLASISVVYDLQDWLQSSFLHTARLVLSQEDVLRNVATAIIQPKTSFISLKRLSVYFSFIVHIARLRRGPYQEYFAARWICGADITASPSKFSFMIRFIPQHSGIRDPPIRVQVLTACFLFIISGLNSASLSPAVVTL